MGFVNKVMLMGNLTRDPELRQLPSGAGVCDFTLAANRVYKTAAGEEKQETVFVDCTAFGRAGEVIAEYCAAGRPLFVEGRLHYETWEDKAGNRRNKLSVIVENFQFVGSRESATPAERPAPAAAAGRRAATDRFERGQRPAERSPKPARQSVAAARGQANEETDILDPDLPF